MPSKIVLFLFSVFLWFPFGLGGINYFKWFGYLLAFSAILSKGAQIKSLGRGKQYLLGACAIFVVGYIGSMESGIINIPSIIKMGSNIILLFSILMLTQSFRNILLVLVGLTSGGVLSMITGFMPGGISYGRAAGIVGNANGYGQICAGAVICLLGLRVFSKNGNVRAALLLLAVPCLLGVFQSQSRGAAIALGVGVLAFALLRSTRRTTFLFVLIGGLAALYTLPEEYFKRWENLFSASKPGRAAPVETRMDLVAQGWTVYKSHPIAGVGFGNVTRGMTELEMNNPRVTHNWLSQCLAETGTVGTVLFVLLLAGAGRACYRVYSDPMASREVRAIAITWLALTLFSTVAQMSSGNYIHPLWYVLFGVSLNLEREARNEEELLVSPAARTAGPAREGSVYA
jgi:O-antigen ligase